MLLLLLGNTKLEDVVIIATEVKKLWDLLVTIEGTSKLCSLKLVVTSSVMVIVLDETNKVCSIELVIRSFVFVTPVEKTNGLVSLKLLTAPSVLLTKEKETEEFTALKLKTRSFDLVFVGLGTNELLVISGRVEKSRWTMV